MFYFSFINNNLQLKNNLEKAVYKLLKDNERLVIPAAEVDDFKVALLHEIRELNGTYKRCTPIEPSWWKSQANPTDKDCFLQNIGFCRFCLYASKPTE